MPLTAARPVIARSGLKGLSLCVAAGALWGFISMVVNSLTGVFSMESSFGHDLVSFIVGGALMGALSGGLLTLAWGVLPFKRALAKALLVTVGLWLSLRLVGALLSHMEPERFHVLTSETLQGLLLSALLGLLLSLAIRPGGRRPEKAA